MGVLRATITLRRDTQINYSRYGTHVPLDGEVCLVDTLLGLRAKVGDGQTAFNALPFADSMVVQGYYNQQDHKFYAESAFTTELPGELNIIYVDKLTGALYFYNGSVFVANTVSLPTATDALPGILKLYGSSGQNTDGTMTQKAITDAISAILFDIETDNTENSLVLDKT